MSERDALNEAVAELRPVLLHHLFHLYMRSFVCCINRHRERRERRFCLVERNRIGEELVLLQRVYREESVFKEAVDTSVYLLDFQRVESDFSLTGSEKKDDFTSLTDFSLKAILHYKYMDLKKLEPVIG